MEICLSRVVVLTLSLPYIVVRFFLSPCFCISLVWSFQNIIFFSQSFSLPVNSLPLLPGPAASFCKHATFGSRQSQAPHLRLMWKDRDRRCHHTLMILTASGHGDCNLGVEHPSYDVGTPNSGSSPRDGSSRTHEASAPRPGPGPEICGRLRADRWAEGPVALSFEAQLTRGSPEQKRCTGQGHGHPLRSSIFYRNACLAAPRHSKPGTRKLES